MLKCRHFVTVQFFDDLCMAYRDSSTELPFYEDYLPLQIESLFNQCSASLKVNLKRKGLFKGKTFLCSSLPQIKRIGYIVRAGGKLYNEKCHLKKVL